MICSVSSHDDNMQPLTELLETDLLPGSECHPRALKKLYLDRVWHLEWEITDTVSRTPPGSVVYLGKLDKLYEDLPSWGQRDNEMLV